MMARILDDYIDKALQHGSVIPMILAQEFLTEDAPEHFFLHLVMHYQDFI